MLYADDLVQTGKITQKVDEMFVRWKKAMKNKGFRMNIGKIKLIVSGANSTEPVQFCRYP